MCACVLSIVKIEKPSTMGHVSFPITTHGTNVLIQMSFFPSRTNGSLTSVRHTFSDPHNAYITIFFRYGCTNNVEILQTLIIPEFIIHNNLGKVRDRRFFIPVFDLPYSNAFVFVIITTYPF